MSIRILGGQAKGLQLAGPKSSHTRPTSVMLKRRLFDSIQNFQGLVFVDLCAGTGSVGIEALSRGADKVICVDNSKQAIAILKQNQKLLSKYHIDQTRLEIVQADFLSWLTTNQEQFENVQTVVFFDPPYELIESYRKVYEFFANSHYSVKLVLEGCSQKTMKLDKFLEQHPNAAKTFKQGTSFFVIYDFE